MTQAGPPSGKGAVPVRGRREALHLRDTCPREEPKFFDPNGAVTEVPYSSLYPDGVVPPVSPCTGCPSSGTTSPSSS